MVGKLYLFPSPLGDNEPREVIPGPVLDRMLEIRDKWGIGVVDLWNNEEMTAVTEKEEEISKLMGDPVHPFRDGYVNWWLPEFEKAFTEYFSNNQ